MMYGTKAILTLVIICLVLFLLFASDEQMFFEHIQLFYQSVLLLVVAMALVMIRVVWKIEKT
jgi:hypothetical protein